MKVRIKALIISLKKEYTSLKAEIDDHLENGEQLNQSSSKSKQ